MTLTKLKQPMTWDIELDTLIADTDNHVWYVIANSNHVTASSPTWESSKVMTVTFNTVTLRIWYLDTSTHTDSRDIYTFTNASEATYNPTGVISTTAWTSPRAAYADETISFVIQGDTGTPVEIELRTLSGEIIAETNNYIKSDGNFFWNFPLSNHNIDSLVYAIEISQNVRSLWGYISPSPSVNQVYLDLSVSSTAPENEQLENSFSTYFSKKGENFKVHWKTNLETWDYATHYFQFSYLDAGIFYTASVSYLASSYWTDSNNVNASIAYVNQDLAHWRYAIFTFDGTESGFNNYDDIIIDLSRPLTVNTGGFYKPSIYSQNNAEEITTTINKGAWYGAVISDGVIATLNKLNYANNEDIIFTLSVGTNSGVLSYLNILDFTIIDVDDSNNPVFSTRGDTINNNTNVYTTENSWLPNGNYALTYSLSQVNISNTFKYSEQLPFTIGGDVIQEELSEVKSISESIETVLGNYGLDNKVGQYIIIFILAIVAFAIAYKSALLRVVFPCLIIGFGIIIGWIDTWVVVLLALGAGFTLYRALTKTGESRGEK